MLHSARGLPSVLVALPCGHTAKLPFPVVCHTAKLPFPVVCHTAKLPFPVVCMSKIDATSRDRASHGLSRTMQVTLFVSFALFTHRRLNIQHVQ